MNNEENKDLLETTLDEFFAKYPDCRIDREDRINSENIDLFCQWAMEGIELVEDQIGYFSSEEDEIFTENQKLHFNNALNEKGSISKELNVNENQASFFDDGQIDFGADPQPTRMNTEGNEKTLEELLSQLGKGGKIDWEHKSEKDIEFKIKNGIDIEINICCLPEPVLSKKQEAYLDRLEEARSSANRKEKIDENGQVDFGADPEVTKKLTKYFNNKGKKLRKQELKIAEDDKIFFLK